MNNTIKKRLELFREKFTLDPLRVFFGDPEELKKQGWEVGESKLIIKQDSTPEDLEQFIRESMEQVRTETLEEFKKAFSKDNATFMYKEDGKVMSASMEDIFKELKPNE
jgi:hypothetical protein